MRTNAKVVDRHVLGSREAVMYLNAIYVINTITELDARERFARKRASLRQLRIANESLDPEPRT